MPRVAVLPSAVADQIAAGEVIERPASVVKELVDNALDAGATSVDVVIEDGGRGLVRVSDDGSGMDRDDAVLALSRHATSKIRSSEDLVGVRSFGFRGEAIPAICSVSHFDLETAPDDGAGTRIRAAGGALLDVSDAARRRGTTVSVSRLFYNVPARLKFLRSARSEWRAVSEALTVAALVRRDVRFTAHHDGRSALALPPALSLRARVAALWGNHFAERFLDADDVQGATHAAGLVERPADVGSGARRLHLAINGRAVRDVGIVRAAELAYRSTLPSGARPSLFLELTVPADTIDVNVHPAKAEVRFRDRWTVERAVEAGVRRALGSLASAAALGGRYFAVAAAPVMPAPVDVEMLAPRPEPGPLFGDGELAPADDAAAVAMLERDFQHSPSAVPPAPEPDVPPLTQWRRTYVVFEHEDGMVLIDQHSAHERVLFEQFMRTLLDGGAPSQRLLFPLTMHLGPAEADAFEASRDSLERLGFEVEGFGGHTLLVRAVPTPHPRFDAERCLRETLASLGGDRTPDAAARHEKLAATIACKAAIKAGEQLSAGEMRALFVSLSRTTLPAHDVHGRSTIVQLSWDEVERRFGRK